MTPPLTNPQQIPCDTHSPPQQTHCSPPIEDSAVLFSQTTIPQMADLTEVSSYNSYNSTTEPQLHTSTGQSHSMPDTIPLEDLSGSYVVDASGVADVDGSSDIPPPPAIPLPGDAGEPHQYAKVS